MATKRFSIGTILTVTTGKFVTTLDELYAIMSHLMGFSVFTHELALHAKAAKAGLLKQLPQFADVDSSMVNNFSATAWLAEQEARFGSEFDVEPLSDEGRTQSPMETLVQLRGGNTDGIIAVPVSDDPQVAAEQVISILKAKSVGA